MNHREHVAVARDVRHLDTDSEAYVEAVLTPPAEKERLDAAGNEPWLIDQYGQQ